MPSTKINTNTIRCALCQSIIDSHNNSSEHIIPNSIGGHKLIKNFLCKSCNNGKGEDWDASLAKQLNYFSLALNIKRTRGSAPDQNVKTDTGTSLLLRSNGTLTASNPLIEIDKNEKTARIKIFARDISEARRTLENIKRKHIPNLDVEKELEGFEVGPFRVDGAIQHRLELGNAKASRPMVKTALALAFTLGIEASECRNALKTLLSESDNSAYTIFYLSDVVNNRIEGELCHIVSLRGSKERGTLSAYIEYFNYLRIIATLSDSYSGNEINNTYGINPRTGEEISPSVNWEKIYSLIDAAFSGYINEFELNRACSQAINTASFHRTSRERRHRFHKELEATLLEMGLPPGSTPPKSRRTEFDNLMTKKLGSVSDINSNIKSFDEIIKR